MPVVRRGEVKSRHHRVPGRCPTAHGARSRTTGLPANLTEVAQPTLHTPTPRNNLPVHLPAVVPSRPYRSRPPHAAPPRSLRRHRGLRPDDRPDAQACSQHPSRRPHLRPHRNGSPGRGHHWPRDRHPEHRPHPGRNGSSVQWHFKNILGKLGLGTQADLVRRRLSNPGLAAPPPFFVDNAAIKRQSQTRGRTAGPLRPAVPCQVRVLLTPNTLQQGR